MRGARLGAFGLIAILFASANALADTTPPVITPATTGTLGGGGWSTSDVTVAWTVFDGESAIVLSSGCGTSQVTTDTSGVDFTCSATSLGGTTAVTQTIRRDTTGPVVVFVGNAGTYSVEQTVLINCNAFDALSSVASSTCGGPITGIAHSFPLEQTVTSVFSATDVAGNETHEALSFFVDVTAAGIGVIVDQVATRRHIAHSLKMKLQKIEQAALSGDLRTEERNYDSFVAQVNREIGKHLSPGDAALLLRLAPYLRTVKPTI